MKYACVLSSEYCMDHWKEDRFFGYQCLNGSNPRMIQRCKKLPKNFPVEPNMVQSSMANGTSLDKELKVEEYCQYNLLPNVTNRNKKHWQNGFIGLFVQLMLSSFHVHVFIMFCVFRPRQVISTCWTTPSWMGFPPTQSGVNFSISLLHSVSSTNTQMRVSYLLLYRYTIHIHHTIREK